MHYQERIICDDCVFPPTHCFDSRWNLDFIDTPSTQLYCRDLFDPGGGDQPAESLTPIKQRFADTNLKWAAHPGALTHHCQNHRKRENWPGESAIDRSNSVLFFLWRRGTAKCPNICLLNTSHCSGSGYAPGDPELRLSRVSRRSFSPPISVLSISVMKNALRPARRLPMAFLGTAFFSVHSGH